MAKFKTIEEALNSVSDRSSSVTIALNASKSSDLARYQMHLKHRNDRTLDKHTIDNPLSEEDMRILLKILNKAYKDCGRKRGAILRYIKNYKDEEERISKKLARALSAKATHHR